MIKWVAVYDDVVILGAKNTYDIGMEKREIHLNHWPRDYWIASTNPSPSVSLLPLGNVFYFSGIWVRYPHKLLWCPGYHFGEVSFYKDLAFFQINVLVRCSYLLFCCPDTIIRRMFGETHNVCMIFPFANFVSPFLLKQSFSILLFLEKTYFSPRCVHLPFKTPVLFLSPSRAYATKVWVNQCRQYSVTNGLKMAAHTISTDVLLPWHTLYSCRNNLSSTSGQQLLMHRGNIS